MTTNLAECINSVLKGARSLPICAIVKTTFERTKDWFVERGTKAECMLWAGHLYPKDITAQLCKNEQQSAMCIVHRYDRQNSEFEVQEIPTPQLRRRPVIQNQIKWMVVWLWTVSSPEVALSTCHSCLFIFSYTVSHIRFSRLQPQQHFKGLWNSIPSSSKPRLLVSLHRSKYDTWPTHEKKQSWKTNYKSYP